MATVENQQVDCHDLVKVHQLQCQEPKKMSKMIHFVVQFKIFKCRLIKIDEHTSS